MSSEREEPETSDIAGVSWESDTPGTVPVSMDDEDTIDLLPETMDEEVAMDTDQQSDTDMSGDLLKKGPGRPRKEGQSLTVVVSKKKNKNKSHKKDRHKPSPDESEVMVSPAESVIPDMLSQYSHPDDDTESENGELTPPLGPPKGLTIRHRLSDHSRDSIGSDIVSTASAIYTGPTSLTIKVGGEEMGKIITGSNAPMDRTMSDDSDYSNSDDEQTCSFCNRGQKSLLGQGDLTRYDPTPSYNVFKKTLHKLRRSSSEYEYDRNDRSPKHLTWRRARGPPKVGIILERNKSPRRSTHGQTDSDGRPVASVDELSLVGHTEDADLDTVFEKTGHTNAHHCCAAWSENVIQSEDYSLLFVDKAVLSGMTQKCSYCRRYGATIKCRSPKCPKKYHYPCASGGGCFQEIRTLYLLCPDHADQAEQIGESGQEALCVVCDSSGNISEQLFCTSCGQHYHGNCLDPPVEVNPVVRAGWQCPDCKICQTCRQPGDDNKMLVCDTCDKGYHTFCLVPVMTTIPKNGWKCKNCRVCGDCGSRTPGNGPSSRWHLNYSVCDSCYQQRNKGLCCPLCGKAYRQFTQKKMIQCNICTKYVHADCDGSIDQSLFDRRGKTDPEYTCPTCKNRDSSEIQEIAFESMLADEGSLQDIEGFGIFRGLKAPGDGIHARHEHEEGEILHHTQDSLLLTEDSVSSMDMDLHLGMQHLPGAGAGHPPTVTMVPTATSIAGSGTTSASHTPSSSPSPRPVGPGIGKPSFGKKLGKKLGNVSGRTQTSKGRVTVGIGKKRQRGPVGKKKKVPTATLR